MGDQYRLTAVKIKTWSGSKAEKNVTLTSYLRRNQQSLDLGHFIAVLGNPGSSGLNNGLRKSCK